MYKSYYRDRTNVGDIIDHIDKVHEYLPASEAEFLQDDMLKDAVLMRLQTIGELMRGLSAEFREQYPDLYWVQATGMRNMIAHEYGKIDFKQVWQGLHESFPDFEKKIRTIGGEIGTE